MTPVISDICFVFDVEAIGLHGEAYAVAWTVFKGGKEIAFGRTACDPSLARGDDEDRRWIADNIPGIPINSPSPGAVRDSFWWAYKHWKKEGASFFAECAWPVEGRFLCKIIDQNPHDFKFAGPYPLHEIASFMAAAGMDPMASYPYEEGETKHDPLSDARQSARLLNQALAKLSTDG